MLIPAQRSAPRAVGQDLLTQLSARLLHFSVFVQDIMGDNNEVQMITKEAIRFRRTIQQATFFRAAGLPVPQQAVLKNEGVTCFTDQDGHKCLIYDCYNPDDVQAARLITASERISEEEYRGPGNCVDRVTFRKGGSVHRPRVLIFRVIS